MKDQKFCDKWIFHLVQFAKQFFEIWHVFPRMKSKNSIKGQTNTTYTHFVIQKFLKFHLFWLSMYNTRILLPISIRDASNIKQYTGGSEKPIHFQNKCPLFNLFWKSNLVSFNTFSTSFTKIWSYWFCTNSWIHGHI